MAQDRKFKFEDGKFINRVSGEAIPDDEPVIIFRARDMKALPVLDYYKSLCVDEKHREAIQDRIDEFQAYRNANAGRMKEPGITGDILLNRECSPDALTTIQDREATLIRALRDARGAIASLPADGLGLGHTMDHHSGDAIPYPIRDELLGNIDEALGTSGLVERS